MQRVLCLIVPAVLLIAGCFRSNSNGPDAGEDASCSIACCDGARPVPPTSACTCAGGSTIAPIDGCALFPSDAGVDASTDAGCLPDPDARCCEGSRSVEPTGLCPLLCPEGSELSRFECEGPAECPLFRATSACVPGAVVPAGEAFEMPVTLTECGCAEDAACRVRVTAGRIELTTTMCDSDIDCDGCSTISATCAVPAVTPGSYDVVVNGDDAFRVEARPSEGGFLPLSNQCVGFAEPDACSASQPLDDQRPDAFTELCYESGFGGDALFVRAINNCGTCDTAGTCEVQVDQRLTDDLPPGGEIHITSNRYFSACAGDCIDVCMRSERRCRVPGLNPGDFYRVHVDGRVVDSFEYNPGERRECVSTGR